MAILWSKCPPSFSTELLGSYLEIVFEIGENSLEIGSETKKAFFKNCLWNWRKLNENYLLNSGNSLALLLKL